MNIELQPKESIQKKVEQSKKQKAKRNSEIIKEREEEKNKQKPENIGEVENEEQKYQSIHNQSPMPVPHIVKALPVQPPISRGKPKRVRNGAPTGIVINFYLMTIYYRQERHNLLFNLK